LSKARKRWISSSEAPAVGATGQTATRVRSGANRHKENVEVVGNELAVHVVYLFITLAIALV
jgi:hypothetical protein